MPRPAHINQGQLLANTPANQALAKLLHLKYKEVSSMLTGTMKYLRVGLPDNYYTETTLHAAKRYCESLDYTFSPSRWRRQKLHDKGFDVGKSFRPNACYDYTPERQQP